VARPREFDEDIALELGMQVFWARGYEGATLNHLLDGMGLSKSSFYETFGSKHDLFVAALDLYFASVVEDEASGLENAQSGRRAITSYFDKIVATAGKEDADLGCFLVNCATEVAAFDGEALERIDAGFARYEKAFRTALKNAQQSREVAKRKDPRSLSRFLTSGMCGMRVMAQAGAKRAALRDIARTTLSQLD